jgi:thymidylate kinase
LTLLLLVSPELSRERQLARQATMAFLRDRIEEADRCFFERVAKGYQALAAAEPKRIRALDASKSVPELQAAIWKLVAPLVGCG